MDLEDLLNLLPDNTVGSIDAVDLRTIVTELYGGAQVVAQVFGYTWQVNPANPSNGRASISPAWGVGSTMLVVNNTTDSGLTLTFEILDRLVAPRIVVVGTNGGDLHADVTGPSVDQGSFRQIPIHVVGTPVTPAPINNEKVSLIVRGTVP